MALDAIFATDMIAPGAMRALAEAGLPVPEDVSIVGLDGITSTSAPGWRRGSTISGVLRITVATVPHCAPIMPDHFVDREARVELRCGERGVEVIAPTSSRYTSIPSPSGCTPRSAIAKSVWPGIP